MIQGEPGKRREGGNGWKRRGQNLNLSGIGGSRKKPTNSQRRMRQMHQKMNVELRGFVQKELDALEAAIEKDKTLLQPPPTKMTTNAEISQLNRSIWNHL